MQCPTCGEDEWVLQPRGGAWELLCADGHEFMPYAAEARIRFRFDRAEM